MRLQSHAFSPKKAMVVVHQSAADWGLLRSGGVLGGAVSSGTGRARLASEVVGSSLTPRHLTLHTVRARIDAANWPAWAEPEKHRPERHPSASRAAFSSATAQVRVNMVEQEPCRPNDGLKGLWDGKETSGSGQEAHTFHPC